MPKRRSPRSQTRLAEPTERAAPRGRAGTSPWAIKAPAVLLLVGALSLFARLLSDARFQVHEVEVVGLQQVTREEVGEVVDVLGHSLFTVRASVLAAELPDRFGCIDSAEVRCRLPDRVTVTLHEEDVALVWQSGERYWWLGPDAGVLGETDDPRDLLVVRDVGGLVPEPEDYVPGVPVALARDLGRALAANRRYDYTAEAGLVAYVTAEGWPVYLGHEGDAAAKVAIMRALVDELVRRNVSVAYIDLRNEVRPTYKPG